MYIETDGYNIRLRFVDDEVMKRGDDLLFSFPEFFEYSHLKDIFSLGDIAVKELKQNDNKENNKGFRGTFASKNY